MLRPSRKSLPSRSRSRPRAWSDRCRAGPARRPPRSGRRAGGCRPAAQLGLALPTTATWGRCQKSCAESTKRTRRARTSQPFVWLTGRGGMTSVAPPQRLRGPRITKAERRVSASRRSTRPEPLPSSSPHQGRRVEDARVQIDGVPSRCPRHRCADGHPPPAGRCPGGPPARRHCRRRSGASAAGRPRTPLPPPRRPGPTPSATHGRCRARDGRLATIGLAPALAETGAPPFVEVSDPVAAGTSSHHRGDEADRPTNGPCRTANPVDPLQGNGWSTTDGRSSTSGPRKKDAVEQRRRVHRHHPARRQQSLWGMGMLAKHSSRCPTTSPGRICTIEMVASDVFEARSRCRQGSPGERLRPRPGRDAERLPPGGDARLAIVGFSINPLADRAVGAHRGQTG